MGQQVKHELNTPARLPQRSIWVGVAAGWLVQLALKAILPLLVLAVLAGPFWYVSQAAIFIGSAIAGGLAARLAPGKPLAVAAALVLLSLLSSSFEQFPQPLSGMVQFIWLGGPCLGLIMGLVLARRLMRGAR